MQTIFAPITADINAPIALIRISGPNAIECLEFLGVKKKDIKPRFAYLSKFFWQGEFLDEGLFTYFKAPNSFTGFDVVEVAIHGSRLNLAKFLEILGKIPNYRYAEAGEFSRQAFMNEKIDLVQAEGINDFIKAETDLQLTQAKNLFTGKSSKIFNEWREELVTLLSLVEAYIDFPDEDLPTSLLTSASDIVSKLIKEAEDFVADNKYGEQIRSGFYVAIIGKPNVGKSTLLNKLSGRDVAITSNIAGTTRDIIEVHLDIAGIPVVMADTAGIRETADEIEKIGVDRAKEVSRSANLIIHLLDSSDERMTNQIEELESHDKVIQIAAKADIALADNIDFCKEHSLPLYSFMQDEDLKKIVSSLENKIKESYHLKARSLLASKRHLEEIKQYLLYLNKFSLEEDVVIVALNLRLAVNAIDRIVGTIDVEEILGKIFTSFCIGK